jgi:hypothetical protein
MNLYVAAKFEDQARAREVMAVLVAAGHAITHDWTREAPPMSRKQAEADRLGVMEADALVFIAERDLPYCGSLVEMGIAVARRIPILFLGQFAHPIFELLPFVQRYNELRAVLLALEAMENLRCHT